MPKTTFSPFLFFYFANISKSVFARHYLKVENVKELVQKANAATDKIESSLLPQAISL